MFSLHLFTVPIVTPTARNTAGNHTSQLPQPGLSSLSSQNHLKDQLMIMNNTWISFSMVEQALQKLDWLSSPAPGLI